jgi:hypothetical protein
MIKQTTPEVSWRMVHEPWFPLQRVPQCGRQYDLTNYWAAKTYLDRQIIRGLPIAHGPFLPTN